MSRDLRKYAGQTNTRLVLGGLLFAVVVGIGLIYILYGPDAAVTGLVCILAGMSPLALIVLALWVTEGIARRANRE